MKSLNTGRLGFTLIELLVVVLIIGILAAVALPQYQKAVEKSKSAQALAMLKSMVQSQESYFLANNEFANEFEQLDVDIPWTGSSKWINEGSSRSNADWSVQLYNASGAGRGISVGRISGPYAGAGFVWTLKPGDYPIYPQNELFCFERKSGGVIFNKATGDYCCKIMHMDTYTNSGKTACQ